METKDLINAAEQAGWTVSAGKKSWVFTSAADAFAIPAGNLAEMCINVISLATAHTKNSSGYEKIAKTFQALANRNLWTCCDESCSLYFLPVSEHGWKAIGIKPYKDEFVVCGCTCKEEIMNANNIEDVVAAQFFRMTLEKMDFAATQHSYEECEAFIKEWIKDSNGIIAPTKAQYNTMVYQKVFAEMEAYKSRLLALAPGEILDFAYEYSIKSDMLLVFEDSDFSISECKLMLSQENLLDQLFRKWEHRADDPHMDELHDMMEGFCKEKEDYHA